MNGMEDLCVREPGDKVLEKMEKVQLVSVICDQQKELNRLRGLLKNHEKTAEMFRRGYEKLAELDWTLTNDLMQKAWRDARLTPPADTSLKWVCSEGGVETAAFFDGQNWYTERHEKINAKVWQHLPHYKNS